MPQSTIICKKQEPLWGFHRPPTGDYCMFPKDRDGIMGCEWRMSKSDLCSGRTALDVRHILSCHFQEVLETGMCCPSLCPVPGYQCPYKALCYQLHFSLSWSSSPGLPGLGPGCTDPSSYTIRKNSSSSWRHPVPVATQWHLGDCRKWDGVRGGK